MKRELACIRPISEFSLVGEGGFAGCQDHMMQCASKDERRLRGADMGRPAMISGLDGFMCNSWWYFLVVWLLLFGGVN